MNYEDAINLLKAHITLSKITANNFNEIKYFIDALELVVERAEQNDNLSQIFVAQGKGEAV